MRVRGNRRPIFTASLPTVRNRTRLRARYDWRRGTGELAASRRGLPPYAWSGDATSLSSAGRGTDGRRTHGRLRGTAAAGVRRRPDGCAFKGELALPGGARSGELRQPHSFPQAANRGRLVGHLAGDRVGSFLVLPPKLAVVGVELSSWSQSFLREKRATGFVIGLIEATGLAGLRAAPAFQDT